MTVKLRAMSVQCKVSSLDVNALQLSQPNHQLLGIRLQLQSAKILRKKAVLYLDSLNKKLNISCTPSDIKSFVSGLSVWSLLCF